MPVIPGCCNPAGRIAEMRRNRTPESEALTHAFAQRTKAARDARRMSQVRLQELLAQRGVLIDTSGITRIEAEEREPRLSEALAISEILGFGLSNLMTPASESDVIRDVRQLIEESRGTLLKLLRALDRTADLLPKGDTPSDPAGELKG